MDENRIIVGITGASGVIYGVRVLQVLADLDIETHLVISKAAALTLEYETELSANEVKAMAAVVHPVGDLGAACSSGSFRTRGMIIAPCSMRSLAEIATGCGTSRWSRRRPGRRPGARRRPSP